MNVWRTYEGVSRWHRLKSRPDEPFQFGLMAAVIGVDILDNCEPSPLDGGEKGCHAEPTQARKDRDERSPCELSSVGKVCSTAA